MTYIIGQNLGAKPVAGPTARATLAWVFSALKAAIRLPVLVGKELGALVATLERTVTTAYGDAYQPKANARLHDHSRPENW